VSTSANAHAGIWFFRDPTGREIAAWLGAPDPGRERRAVCLVPPGAPLQDRWSAVSNVKLLLELSGQTCRTEDAIAMLRAVEIPDRLLHARAQNLSSSQRLAVWLAIGRLRNVSMVVLIEPFAGVSATDVPNVARLVREAGAAGKTMLLVSVDPTVSDACGALPVSDLRNPPW